MTDTYSPASAASTVSPTASTPPGVGESVTSTWLPPRSSERSTSTVNRFTTPLSRNFDTRSDTAGADRPTSSAMSLYGHRVRNKQFEKPEAGFVAGCHTARSNATPMNHVETALAG